MMRRHSLINYITGFLYLPFIFSLAYLTYSYPNQLVRFGYGSFLLVVTFVIFAVLPVGRLTLGESKAMPLPSWLAKILSLQVIMILLFVAGVLAFFAGGPVFAAQSLSFEVVRQSFYENTWLLWSFNPWCCILMWALCLGYYYHVRKAGPYPHQVCQDTMKNILEPQTKAFVETNVFTINMICIAITFSIATLLFSYAIELYFGMVPHTLGAPITFMVLSLVVLLFLWRLHKNRIRKLEKRGLTSSGLMTLLMVGFIIAIVYSSYALEWILNNHDKISLKQLQCSCQKFFDHVPVESRIAAYLWGWGLLWTPMIGSYLVSISGGRTLREIIIGFLALPSILLGVLMVYPQWVEQAALQWVSWFSVDAPVATKAFLLLPFAVLAFLVLRWMTFGKTSTHFLNAGFLAPQDTYSSGRTKLKEGVKLFGFSKMGVPYLFACLSVIAMHTMGGWYLIQINVVLLAPILMYFVYCACVFLWVQFIQKGLVFKN